jgi:hypothetical protein
MTARALYFSLSAMIAHVVLHRGLVISAWTRGLPVS